MKNKKIFIWLIPIIIIILIIIIGSIVGSHESNKSFHNNSNQSTEEKPPFFDNKYTLFQTTDGRGVYLTFFPNNECYLNFNDFVGSYKMGGGEKISILYDTRMYKYSYANHIITITGSNNVRMDYTFLLGTGQVQTKTIQSNRILQTIKYEYNEEDDTMRLLGGEWHYEPTYNNLLYIYFMTEEEAKKYKETHPNEWANTEKVDEGMKKALEEERTKKETESITPKKERETIDIKVDLEKKETILIKFFLNHPEEIKKISINGQNKSYESGNNEFSLEPSVGNNNIHVEVEFNDGYVQKIDKNITFDPEPPKIFVKDFDGGCNIIVSSYDNYSSANEASYNTLDQMDITFDDEPITSSQNIKEQVTINGKKSSYFHPTSGTHIIRYRNKYGKEGTEEITIPDSCS